MRKDALVVLAFAAATLMVCPGHGQDKGSDQKEQPLPKPLPENIVREWKAGGFETNWMLVDNGDVSYVDDGILKDFFPDKRYDPASVEILPVFSFEGNKGVGKKLLQLAAPEEAFGLVLQSQMLADDDLKALAGMKDLRALDIRSSYFSRAGLEELGGLKSLQILMLDLPEAYEDAARLKDLARLKRLRAFWLSGPSKGEVTQADLRALAAMEDLRTLNLKEAPATAAWLKGLAKLKNLHTLILPANITDGDLKELAPITSLNSLNLDYTKVTDAGLKELAALKGLTRLSARNANITGSGIEDLKNLKALNWLDLGETRLTDDGMKYISSFAMLKVLLLENTAISDDGLKELKSLQKLELLVLSRTKITDAGLKHLQPLKNLRSLLIQQNTELTKAGVERFAKALPECKITR